MSVAKTPSPSTMSRWIGLGRTRKYLKSLCWKQQTQWLTSLAPNIYTSTVCSELSPFSAFTARMSFSINRKMGSLQDFLSHLSSRDKAHLEQQLFDAFASSYPGHPIDPILNKEMGSLGWVRSIRVEKDHTSDRTLPLDGKEKDNHKPPTYSISVTLKLPPLYPSVDIVKSRISDFLASLLVDMGHKSGWNILSSSTPAESNIANAINFRLQSTKQLPYFVQELETYNPNEARERLKNLGPGLEHVLHYVAVYSCKVRTRPLLDI